MISFTRVARDYYAFSKPHMTCGRPLRVETAVVRELGGLACARLATVLNLDLDPWVKQVHETFAWLVPSRIAQPLGQATLDQLLPHLHKDVPRGRSSAPSATRSDKKASARVALKAVRYATRWTNSETAVPVVFPAEGLPTTMPHAAALPG